MGPGDLLRVGLPVGGAVVDFLWVMVETLVGSCRREIKIFLILLLVMSLNKEKNSRILLNK